ncbi:MAG: molybdopterin-dependent oxidoreductase [Planctomycetota bacterium]
MTEQQLRTTCNRDCPDACGILATVRDGVVTKLEGDPKHPITRGFLCFRTSRFTELQYSDQRVTEPLIRRDGQLVPASWDEALDLIASRMQTLRAESGPASIFHYRSGGSLGILKHLTDRFFDLFGPCTTKIGDICSGAGEAAQLEDFGTSDSNDLFDLRKSRNIVLWGKNPKVSNVHLVPVLQEAKARGARIWMIDPLEHKSTGLAEQSLRPRPGGDLDLAMGVARALFDSGRMDPDAAEFCDNLDGYRALAHRHEVAEWATLAGLETAEVLSLADAFADGPTAIQVGWGMQRRQRGGATVRALDALCAVSGNLFVGGGGVSFYFGRRKPFAPFGEVVTPPRVIREPMFAQDLAAAQDPPVRMLWVTAGNPVAMLPDSRAVAAAIEKTEFVVVADCLMTETAQRADVVLPVPTLLEDSDLLGSYGHHWIAESQPVVRAPDGVRHEVTIFQDLAKRLGIERYPQDPVDLLKRSALVRVSGQGASLESLRADGAVRSPVATPMLFQNQRVLTENGRVQLLDKFAPSVEVAAPAAFAGASEPLWLFSNSTEKSQGSQWAGKGLGEHTWIVVHPEAAAGCAEGSLVRVASPTGELVAELRFDDRQRRDVAIMPKGGWFGRGHSANTLIQAKPTDIGLGAAYLDCLVRIGPS